MAKRSHPSYNNSPLPQSIQPPHKIRKLNNLNSNLPPAPRANAVEPVGHQASRLESPSALIHPSILYPGQYLPTQMYQQGPMPSVVPPAPIYPPLPPVPMHKPLANQSTSSTSSSTIQQGQSNTQKSTQYPKVTTSQSSVMDNVNQCMTQLQQHIATVLKASEDVKGKLVKEESARKLAKLELNQCKQEIAKLEKDNTAQRTEFDKYKAETTASINQMQQKNFELLNDNKAAEGHIERLRKDKDVLLQYKRGTMDHRLARIHELNEEEMKQLKDNINEGLEKIQMEESVRLNCVICMDRKPNICFMDGCEHFLICSVCESGLAQKMCPRCNTPYTRSKRLQM